MPPHSNDTQIVVDSDTSMLSVPLFPSKEENRGRPLLRQNGMANQDP